VKPEYLEISGWQLGLAALLLAVNVGLSFALQLGLEKRLLWAAVRMSAQLLLVGYALEWIFRLEAPLPVVGVSLAMSAMAGVAAVRRTTRRFAGIFWDSVASVLGSSFLISGLAVVGILRVEPWYKAQYLVPILGMVLGNTLNGISLGLESFMTGLSERRALIESTLALGGTRWEAAHQEIRRALRTGMVPTINSMVVMGLVSLPGMMTGQILGGVRPIDAVRYQIVIMFMIASATALGMLGVVLMAFRTLFDAHHRLRSDRLKPVKE
jgi:putative ABC transport system permease protein